MEDQSSVINAGSRRYRTVLHLPLLLRNGLDGRLPLHLMRGKVWCRVITAICTGILTVWSLFFRHYLLLTRNGCVPIMLNGFWLVHRLGVVLNMAYFGFSRRNVGFPGSMRRP